MEVPVTDAVLMIAISEVREAARGVEGLEARLAAACRSAHNFWMSTDDDLRLRAALAATLLETTDPVEGDRLTRSSAPLAAISAALSGVPVDFGRVDAAPDPVPIMKIWRETAP